MKYTHCLITALFVLGLVGCTKSPQELILKDLEEFPQYTEPYTHNIKIKETLLPAQEAYDDRYFEPWEYTQPPFDLEAILWPHRSYTYEKSYGDNLQPLSQEWFERMYAKGNYEAYGSLNKKAISLHYLNLRSFPTQKPVFKDPQRAGEGFPFDYLQNSAIHANEPIFISHYSKDKAWVYVYTSYASGWLPSHTIAFMNKKERKKWKKAKPVYLLKEKVALTDTKGHFLFYSRVGMRLSFVKKRGLYTYARAVAPGAFNKPTFVTIRFKHRDVTTKPLYLNQENLTKITAGVMKSNYGWGGLYEERDCSSTLRDLYAPFGIWLPRNSSEQSKVGKVIVLEEMTLKEKEEAIIKEGVPFETLLYKKGHILLYLGLYNGKIAVLHNAWGVKTMKNGIEGRKIIGKTVISSLNIGKEREDYDPKEGILSQIVSMNILTQE